MFQVVCAVQSEQFQMLIHILGEAEPDAVAVTRAWTQSIPRVAHVCFFDSALPQAEAPQVVLM